METGGEDTVVGLTMKRLHTKRLIITIKNRAKTLFTNYTNTIKF